MLQIVMSNTHKWLPVPLGVDPSSCRIEHFTSEFGVPGRHNENDADTIPADVHGDPAQQHCPGAVHISVGEHTKSFDPVDTISVGVDRIQRNFEPMQRQVESWRLTPDHRCRAEADLLLGICGW